MATVANNRSTLGDLLKNIYEPGLNEAIQNEVFFFKSFTKKTFEGRGKQYVFATHLKRNTKVAARAAGSYFEAAQGETVANGVITPAYVHIPFEIENDLVKAAKTDRAAFKDGMRLVMDTAKTTLLKDLNRMSIGNGRGILATVSGAIADGAATATATVDSTKFLEDGLEFDLWNAAATSGTTSRAAAGHVFYVKVILSDTTFTVSYRNVSTGADANIPAGIVGNEVAIRAGNAYVDTTRKCYEPNGLALFADDGTIDASLHGIASATYSRWKGIQYDASAAAASPALASKVALKFRQKSSGSFDTIWANPTVAHQLIYGTSGSFTNVRYVNGQAVTDLGANIEDVTVNIGGSKVKIKTDIDLAEKEAFFFDSKQGRYVELNGIELEDLGDGQYLTLWRDSTGARPAQVGYWMWRGNFCTPMHNAWARLYNLAAA